MGTPEVFSLAWRQVLEIVGLTSFVSAVSTWFILRFTKPLDSYTTEVAKLWAKHQNLEKLVEETRRITDAAEKIKAELSHENWDRQTRLLAKRDMYVRIAEALGELRTTTTQLKEMGGIRLNNPDFENERRKILDTFNDASSRYFRAIDAAPFLMPDAPYKPLREFKLRKIHFDIPDWEADFEYNIVSVQWALYHFQTAARADLGFQPMVWKPEIVTEPQE
jgi:hypothetical protein